MADSSQLVIELIIAQAEMQVKSFDAMMKKMDSTADKTASSIGGLEKKIDTLGKTTDRAAKKSRAWALAVRSSNKVVGILDRAVRRLAIAFGLAAAAVVTLSIKLATDFEQEMVKIETLVGLNRKMVQGWTADLLEMSRNTGQTAHQLARGLFAITSGGERGTQAMKELAIAAKAAAIGLGDIRDLGRLGAAMVQAYGKNLKTTADRVKLFERSMNTLLEAVRLGNIEAHELSTTIGRAIGPAETLGISFEELAGFIATFSRLGVPAAEVVTSLNSTFTTLIRESDQAQEALGEYGLSIDKVRKKIREDGFAETLVFLVKTFGDNVSGLQEVISNIRALRGVLGTAGAQQKNFLKITKLIELSQDAVSKAFLRQQQTAAQAFKEIRASWHAVLILMGEKTLPVLRKFADSFKKAFESQEVIESFERLGEAAASAVSSIDADKFSRELSRVVGWLTKIIENLDKVYKAMKLAFGVAIVASIIKIADAIKNLTISIRLLVLAINPVAAAVSATIALLYVEITKYFDAIESRAKAVADNASKTKAFYEDTSQSIIALNKANRADFSLGENTLAIYEAQLESIDDQLDRSKRLREQKEAQLKTLEGQIAIDSQLEESAGFRASMESDAERWLKYQNRELAEQLRVSIELSKISEADIKRQAEKLRLELRINKAKDKIPTEPPEIPDEDIQGADALGLQIDLADRLILKLDNMRAAIAEKNQLLSDGVHYSEIENSIYSQTKQTLDEHNRQKERSMDYEEMIKGRLYEHLLILAKMADEEAAATKNRIDGIKDYERLIEKTHRDYAQYRADLEAETKNLNIQIDAVKEKGRLSLQSQAQLEVEKTLSKDVLDTLIEQGLLYEEEGQLQGLLIDMTMHRLSLEKKLTAEQNRRLRDEQVMVDFAGAAAAGISTALATALMGGDMTNVAISVGNNMGMIMGQKIGNAVAEQVETALLESGMEEALAMQIGSAVAAGVSMGVSLLVSYALQKMLNPRSWNRFGTARGLSDETASSSLRGAADELKKAAAALMQAADQFRELTGIGVDLPAFKLLESEGTYYAQQPSGNSLLGSFLEGVGGSPEEAIKEFFFKYLQELARNAVLGFDDLQRELGKEFHANWDYFMGVIQNSLATSYDELARDLQKAKDILNSAMGGVAADINEAMSDMIQMAADGVRLGIDSGILSDALSNSILDAVASIAGAPALVRIKGTEKAFQDLRNEIVKLGLEASETASLIEQIDLYEQFKVLADIGGVFDRVLSAMERAGVRNAQLEKEIATIKQAQFQVELALLQIQLQALDMWTSAMASTFSALEQWGRNLDNFVNEVVGQLDSGLDEEGPGEDPGVKWRREQRDIINDWIDQQLLDPLDYALKKLRQEFKKMKKLMHVFGEGQGENSYNKWLKKAKALGLWDLIDEIGNGFDNWEEAFKAWSAIPGSTSAQLQKAYEAAVRKIYMDYFQPLLDFRDKLRDEPVGQTPVRSLLGAKSRYEKLLAKALAGDEQAALQLAEAGQEYLDVAEQMYGSSRRFRVIQESILAQIEQVLSQWDLDTKSMEEYAEEQTDILSEMLDQMLQPDELDMLTQIRDVLLGRWEEPEGPGDGKGKDLWLGPPEDFADRVFGPRVGPGDKYGLPGDPWNQFMERENAANENMEMMRVDFSEYHAASLILDEERNEILVDIRDYVGGTYEESSSPKPIEESRRAGAI